MEVGRPEAARLEALVPVPVVELPRLALGEDLVGLGRLAEPLARVRMLRDVGMELAREPAERLLDLGLAGRLGDPENLVVVALRRRDGATLAPPRVVGPASYESSYTSSTKSESSRAAERTVSIALT